MPVETFPFTYSDQQFEAKAECLMGTSSYRKYRLDFPNIQSIVEGSVYVNETPEGEWAIGKVVCAHPVHEDFLHDVAQGFVEYIDNQKFKQSHPG